MYETRDLISLLAVITEGSFDAAAKALHVTPGAMSQRIKQLEEKVGQLLVIRGQPARPTVAGEVMLRLARQVSLLSDEAAQRLQGPREASAPRVLSLAVNHDSLATWFRPVFTTLAESGELLLDMHWGDASQTGKLLRDGTAVAAILSAPEPIAGCPARRLGLLRYQAVATPAFMRRWFPGGMSAVALSRAPVVFFDRSDELTTRFIRRQFRKPLQLPAHYVPSSHEMVAAVCAGLGWSLLPAALIKDHLQTGQLVRFSHIPHLDRPIYWQAWSSESPLVRHVLKAVRQAAEQGLLQSRA